MRHPFRAGWIGTLAILAAAGTCRLSAQTDDLAICNRVFSHAFEHRLIDKPIGDVVVSIGREFLGAPYEAGTLDRDSPGSTERLIPDLHSFDCVTFIENVLALARCVKLNTLSYDAYRHQLELIRYRGGRIDGYASRLNYFSEWIRDNERKGIVRQRTATLGGKPVRKPLGFMTSHRKLYPMLASDSTFAAVQRVEHDLSGDTIVVAPEAAIRSHEPDLADGDIVAFTTNVKGLDVSHTGIVVVSPSGRRVLLHAPDAGKVVEVESSDLTAHFSRHPSYTGMMVARPVEP